MLAARLSTEGGAHPGSPVCGHRLVEVGGERPLPYVRWPHWGWSDGARVSGGDVAFRDLVEDDARKPDDHPLRRPGVATRLVGQMSPLLLGENGGLPPGILLVQKTTLRRPCDDAAIAVIPCHRWWCCAIVGRRLWKQQRAGPPLLRVAGALGQDGVRQTAFLRSRRAPAPPVFQRSGAALFSGDGSRRAPRAAVEVAKARDGAPR